MNSLLDSVVSEEVECAICLNKLDTPRILSCLHSFCEKCLEKCIRIRKEDSGTSCLKCALCKEYTTLPSSGVRGLRLDFRATRLVEALIEQELRERKLASSARKCEACGCTDSSDDGVPAESPFTYCRECCQVLCQRCSAAHAGLRSTQSHTVANISDLLNGKVTIQSKDHSMLCPKHNDEKLKIFCVTCLEPVCHDCTLIDHSREHGHQLQFLKDITPTIREELCSRQEEVSEKSEEFTQFLASVDELETHILDHSKDITKNIQGAVEDYKDSVSGLHLAMEKEAFDYLDEKTKQLLQLRKKTQHIKSLAEKSLLMTQRVLENEQDLVGMASMYKSLREAMDRAITERPDEQKLKNIKKFVDRLHYHVTPLEAKVGKVVIGCSCRERGTATVACKNGPKDLQFTRDGRLAVVVQAESIGGKPETVYIKTGTETLYKMDTKDTTGTRYDAYYSSRSSYTPTVRATYEEKDIRFPTVFAAIKQTATSFPNCTAFSWTRLLPTLQYDSIRCFAAFSDHRFVLATTDAKLYLLGDTLTDLSHGLPGKRSVSSIATDNSDNIYIADRDNRRIYVIRSDGNIHRNFSTGELSPTGIAVPHILPQSVAITHEPATVSIIDLEGNVLRSIHHDDWKKVTIACDADRLLYVLWSDRNYRKTLQRFTMHGVEVDALFEKEAHSFNDLLLAVSPSGASVAAVVTTIGVEGKVATIAPKTT